VAHACAEHVVADPLEIVDCGLAEGDLSETLQLGSGGHAVSAELVAAGHA